MTTIYSKATKQALIDAHTVTYNKSQENPDCTTYDIYCDDLAEIEAELRTRFHMSEDDLEATLTDYYKEEPDEILSDD